MNLRPSITARVAPIERGVQLRAVGGMIAAVALASLLLCGVLAWGTPTRWRLSPIPKSSADMEQRLGGVPAHISEFNPVAEPLALPRCGNVRPPEALLTPDPLLPAVDNDALVRVSFIVGSDGHVHSAFVLNGAGPDENEAVLRAVRQWRYRPALCNGVPTDSEARVRFILH
ncbi:MAG TPA: energy transducer TonB [Terriglobales bacterium]|nr:energy transducer TonB [Terriglobales bacterium]